MARNDELAYFALDTYPAHENNKPDEPVGWERLPISMLADDAYGFSASAYRNLTTGEVVISYTGTNSSNFYGDGNDWTGANLPIAGVYSSDQVSRAIEFFCGCRRACWRWGRGDHPNRSLARRRASFPRGRVFRKTGGYVCRGPIRDICVAAAPRTRIFR